MTLPKSPAASAAAPPASSHPESTDDQTPGRLDDDRHEFEYNPQRAFPDFARHQAWREPLNHLALLLPGRKVDIAYGPGRLQTVDIYPARPTRRPPPVHLFFHGGYWRQQDKINFAYIGRALETQGVTAVIANYDLCPEVTLDGVVASALACFEWVCRQIGDHGGDPTRISLSGHSAGAHLVASILATDWSARALDTRGVIGATLISGIYDPTPAIRTSVNADLRLDEALARRHDLERRPPVIQCPASILVGGREPDGWIDQSFRYSRHLRRHGLDPAVHVLPGRDHFDIINDFLDVDGLLMADVLRLSGRDGRR